MNEQQAVFQPYATTRWRSRDVRAIVLLGLAYGWKLSDRTNKAATIRATDGKTIELPDGASSLKMNVFRSWCHQIASHSTDVVLPVSVVQEIVIATKLDYDHARVLLELADDGELVREPTPTNEWVEQAIIEKGGSAETAPYVMTREPYMAMGAAGRRYQSEASLLVTWSDGRVEYECTVCGKAFATSKGAGSHRQEHIKKGEAKPVESSRYTRKHFERKRMTEQQKEEQKMPEAEPVSALKGNDDVLLKVRMLLIPDVVRTHQVEIDRLQQQLDEANAHIERLKNNLKATRDLLGDLE